MPDSRPGIFQVSAQRHSLNPSGRFMELQQSIYGTLDFIFLCVFAWAVRNTEEEIMIKPLQYTQHLHCCSTEIQIKELTKTNCFFGIYTHGMKWGTRSSKQTQSQRYSPLTAFRKCLSLFSSCARACASLSIHAAVDCMSPQNKEIVKQIFKPLYCLSWVWWATFHQF